MAKHDTEDIHTADQQRAQAGFDPAAGVLAWVLPGLGHIIGGRPTRGFGVMAGVLGLFFGGLLIGGITVVDSRSERTETRLSYYGQVLVGPVVVIVDRFHQASYKGVDPLRPSNAPTRHALPHETIENGSIRPANAGEGPPVRRSVGKVNEIGVLYCLIAGMLNFIAILDALLPPGSAEKRTSQNRSNGPLRRSSVLDTVGSPGSGEGGS